MPYIKKENRQQYNSFIEDITNELSNYEHNNFSVGELNYVISSIIWNLFEKNKSYTTGNNLIGVLECVKQEFYRRKVAPYEDKKKEENGDVYEKT